MVLAMAGGRRNFTQQKILSWSLNKKSTTVLADGMLTSALREALNVVCHFSNLNLALFFMTRSIVFIVLSIVSLTSFVSCDCVQIAKAKVLDSQTKQPIDSVSVFKKSTTKQNALTDINGNFELRSISGGLGGCPPMTIVLNKIEYKTKTVDVTSDTTTIIYLDRNWKST